ncbi:MAG: hypothetical protein CL608_16895 [Anaerolineaceae bacterium]|nr:hypothetical protein [Anaerolineaceae bacterium]
MQPRDESYLLDILTACRLIQSFVADMDRDAFDDDLKTQSAVIRQFEILGEATKRLSEELRASQPDIPWRQMAGMRDILIHAYDHVDLDQVWYATQASIPALIPQIEALIK